MQDYPGVFVELNIEFPAGDAESLAVGTAVSKDITYNDHKWTVRCFPRGAVGDASAGEYLSIHLVNSSKARNARVLFMALVLGRIDGEDAATGHAYATVPPSLYTFTKVVEYPEDASMIWRLPRIFKTSDLAEHCVVCGYVTVMCGVLVLRHSPIPVPSSSFVDDLRSVEVRNRFGEPDVKFAVDDKIVKLNRKVLAARSPVFKAELEGPMVESSMPVIHPQHEFKESTFHAMLVYIYQDRLPRDNECEGSLTELLRELLAAADWYGMDRLKLMCAKKLWEDVSVERVSKTLYVADRYNCRELKNACMHFLTVADNMSRVSVTDDYFWLGDNSPSIVQELRERIWAKHN